MNTQALFKISNGMYVVCSIRDGKQNGQVADVVFQVSADPIKIAACIAKKNLTHDFIAESKVFTVSILREKTPMDFIANFGFKSGRDHDKFKDIGYRLGATGAPVVTDNAVAVMEARVTGTMDIGTHTLFVGGVIEAEVLTEEPPMTYEYYRNAKIRSKKEGTIMQSTTMQKYRCTVCSYVYDPAKGDPDSGIQPGTSFADIPDTWVCPVCGVDKTQFEEIK